MILSIFPSILHNKVFEIGKHNNLICNLNWPVKASSLNVRVTYQQ